MPSHLWTVTDKAGNTASRTVNYTVASPSQAVIMGTDWSTANPPEPNYFEGQWPALRAYTRSQALAAVAANLPVMKRICVTDDQAFPVSNPQAMATAFRNALIEFYEGSGSPARRNVGYHWAWRNEIFNEYSTGTLPANVVLGFQLAREVALETKADGSLRWPLAKVVCNATTWTITQGTAAAFWKPIAKHLQGFTWSGYPPGRVKTPVEFTPYQQFVDPVVALIKDWQSDPQVHLEFASIWETGIPVDKANQDTGAPVGTPDWTRRPTYMAGLVQYAKAQLGAEVGIPLDVALYWNRQKALSENDHPPNQFKHDRSKAPNDLATVWHNLIT